MYEIIIGFCAGIIGYGCSVFFSFTQRKGMILRWWKYLLVKADKKGYTVIAKTLGLCFRCNTFWVYVLIVCIINPTLISFLSGLAILAILVEFIEIG